MLGGCRFAASADQAGASSAGSRWIQAASVSRETRVTKRVYFCSRPRSVNPSRLRGIPYRVVIAPQSFKGSADAVAVAAAIARGFRRVLPDARLDEVPLADGGEGTVHALVHATKGKIRTSRVHDPLLREIDAEWGILGDGTTAVVEMAAASGLPLLSEAERDPRITSTRGTGELILAAAASGAHRIVIGIGGSGTNDGGAGMARALGYRFLDRDGRELPEGGAALARLHHLEGQTDPRLIRPAIEVACDVRNPLLGPEGASAIYGPQKGATPAMIAELDAALARYADVIEDFVGRNVRDVPGAGAAGGLGAGLLAFLDARLRSGAELVLDATRFASRVAGADLVVTGEGRADAQSAYGKLTQAVTHAARVAGVRVAMVVGGTAAGYEALLSQGVEAIEVSTPEGMRLTEAMRNPESLIEDAAARLAQHLQSH
ncbi:MAG TPA: glycerate kinase [Chloroflexi bacterium]|nr:glycerate kinase [Chloroflexota bacterium]HAL27632.1 glycerate kinase [Chloroflexota bacterium]